MKFSMIFEAQIAGPMPESEYRLIHSCIEQAVYDEARANRTGDKFVSTVVNDHFSALCPTIVLDDGDQAREIGARGQRFFAEAIREWALPGNPPPTTGTERVNNIAYMAEVREDLRRKIEEGGDNLRTLLASYNPDHAYGTAEDAIAYVEQLEATGADEIMCLIQMGTVPHETCMETIRQWGEKVIPHFRPKRKAA